MCAGRSLDLMNTILNVGSVTFGLKAKKLLEEKGIKSKLIKTDSSDRGGCIYGVKISNKDLYSAIMILKEGGIAFTHNTANNNR